MDQMTATPWFTFDTLYLLDGLSFPVTMIGIFAVADMMKLYLKGGAIFARDAVKDVSHVWDGVKENKLWRE